MQFKIERLILLILFMSIGNICFGQELNCRIIVRYDQIQQTDKQIFKTLEDALNNFVNQTQWTEQTYKNHEKIKCNFILNLSERKGNIFSGDIEVQSVRPVFGTAYSTPLFYFKDKDFSFRYKEFDIIEFSENTFVSNLSSVLAYYIYIIIGIDMDSFAELGGQKHLEKAKDVVNYAQGKNYKGWDSTQNRNRFVLINELLGSDELRKIIYTYHIKYLDRMVSSIDTSKKGITQILPILKRHNQTFIGQMINLVKKDELLSIFEKEKQEEGEVKDLLQSIYNEI